MRPARARTRARIRAATCAAALAAALSTAPAPTTPAPGEGVRTARAPGEGMRTGLAPAPAQGIRTAPAPAQGIRTAPAPAQGMRTGLAPAPAQGIRTGPAPAQGIRTGPAPAQGIRTAPAPAQGIRTGPGPARQGLRWGDCAEKPVPDGMRCATLTVPLDHDHPAKGTTRVALAKLPATAPARGRRAGSLLLNYGGPGAPGIAYLASDPALFAKLNERYDLIAFDPRGVGLSDPVSCGGVQAADSGAGTGDPGDPATQLAALRAEVRQCERHSGRVLQYIGTVHVAHDLDDIRRALGEEKLDYLGFSYGTRLGAVYAALYPENTGRMVLDGVDSLADSLTEQALASARGQQRALDHFLTWCAHQQDCVYGTNTRTAKERVNALVARLDEHPMTGTGGTPFTGDDAVLAIGSALYDKASWPDLAAALGRAEREGDPAGLEGLLAPAEPAPAEPAATGTPSQVPADNASAAITAVNCADDPDRSNDKADPSVIAKEVGDLGPRFREVSEIFGPRQLMTVLACYGRPAGTDFIRRIDHPGAPRMLLVGTRGDPATPYEWTEETARRLGSAVVVDHKGEGHTGYPSSACVRGYVDGFLIDGRLPAGTRACPAGE
ncbi:tripeptidyl-peptidase B [Streptomyces sp. Ag109_G2-6]|uniref:alpha/beta hydrolase n=1 Tax=Streptomyces sp. Ag109_G2-6 TaxID=2485154 RepID=UPI000F93EB87|nr:alpha/beta hydrolase [Streptomyces sp. Ag109_G2-6]RPF41136.1 tripeptidyl-peptidase B [Streptomyces sp. Ag109_G2-6]